MPQAHAVALRGAQCDPDLGLPWSLQVRLMQESVRRIIEAEESRMGEKAWPLLGSWDRVGAGVSEEHTIPGVQAHGGAPAAARPCPDAACPQGSSLSTPGMGNLSTTGARRTRR